MIEAYEIEPWDSTSTMSYPSGKPMPGESEGLGRAMGGMLETGAQMLNPVEALYGVGEMASGVANDAVRVTGGSPREGAPSFTGDLKNLASSAYNQPLQTALNAATAPGIIPGMFTGMNMPKIPKGTGWKLMREKPGFNNVRDSLKDVSRYTYNFHPVTLKENRLKGQNELTDSPKIDRVRDSMGDGTVGLFNRRENAVAFPKRRLSDDEVQYLKSLDEWDPDSRQHTERHEDFHARREFLKPSSGSKEGFWRHRPLDNWVEEANANMVGEKSISGGLNDWNRKLNKKDMYGNYIYGNHGDWAGRALANTAATAAEAARNPIGILNRSAAPLQNFEEYEIEE